MVVYHLEKQASLTLALCVVLIFAFVIVGGVSHA